MLRFLHIKMRSKKTQNKENKKPNHFSSHVKRYLRLEKVCRGGRCPLSTQLRDNSLKTGSNHKAKVSDRFYSRSCNAETLWKINVVSTGVIFTFKARRLTTVVIKTKVAAGALSMVSSDSALPRPLFAGWVWMSFYPVCKWDIHNSDIHTIQRSGKTWEEIPVWSARSNECKERTVNGLFSPRGRADSQLSALVPSGSSTQRDGPDATFHGAMEHTRLPLL